MRSPLWDTDIILHYVEDAAVKGKQLGVIGTDPVNE